MSDFIAETFSQYGKNSKVIKISDGLELRDYIPLPDRSVLRKQLGVQDDELLIGLIANIAVPWKKHEIFIEMAALLKDELSNVRFVHFGHIPPFWRRGRQRYDMLCKMIDDFGLTDRFIWGGAVNHIPEMMAALDLLVHPTDVEPFGRVAIEAMAAGVPVVGAAKGGIAESVVDGKTGLLVPAGQPRAFADAVLKLLMDPALRGQLGKAGVTHVRENFSIEQHVRQIEEIFEVLL